MLDFVFNSFKDLFKSRRLSVADEANVPDDDEEIVDRVDEDDGDEVTELLLFNVLFLMRTGDI